MREIINLLANKVLLSVAHVFSGAFLFTPISGHLSFPVLLASSDLSPAFSIVPLSSPSIYDSSHP